MKRLSLAFALFTLGLIAEQGQLVSAQEHARLSYHGGPILTSFRIYPLFYGKWDTNEVNAHYNYLNGLAGYLSGLNTPVNQEPMMRQYGVISVSVAPRATEALTVTAGAFPDDMIRSIIHANQNS